MLSTAQHVYKPEIHQLLFGTGLEERIDPRLNRMRIIFFHKHLNRIRHPDITQ